MKKVLFFLIVVFFIINSCKKDEGDVFAYPVMIDMQGNWKEYILQKNGNEQFLWDWYFVTTNDSASRKIIFNTPNTEPLIQPMKWEEIEPKNISGASSGIKMTWVTQAKSGCVPCHYTMLFQNARVVQQKRVLVKYSEGCSGTYDPNRVYVWKRQ